ncbi:claudin domain-containing protein 1-like isoform X1 [Girardinichthys multiradiatus]|uniref:claudin domain-containing protein 1-like isoform X1 n=1 Tax=Girardinichthys multiradiatus TaxID=208333 RepID=UPI001FAD3A6A|nr:claudin domain-containing protein 1-like isoform X1 [Girardinichthys multiradiatus]XP_047222888.1 claudin domain-containing protein 1-like isoform X1 [Girardinichthys multiradiatus]XP_047222889.1 claudin domain-containing protein 1-like isoform X1 [Girardinichthys multiradiatus]XP_047222890.1 claudin domain-containing protein 1-like isoform X1 [Girardinichthys multiradiatus]
MVDNRYATALVIGSVLSLLATVYLSVAVGTQHWFQFSSPPIKQGVNLTDLKEEFVTGDFEEKNYSNHLFMLNGSLGLWWRCIQVPSQSYWFREPDDLHAVNESDDRTQLPDCTHQSGCPDPKMETFCVSFTLPQQFKVKTKQPTDEEDLLRTYLWRGQFLLPLVSLALVFLSGLVGVCACLCRSFTPTLGMGVLHFIAGLCSLGTVCCFRAGIDLLQHNYIPPKGADGSMGWSLYLALISFPLQMMAAALFLWAARSHRKHYTRMAAYRVA